MRVNRSADCETHYVYNCREQLHRVNERSQQHKVYLIMAINSSDQGEGKLKRNLNTGKAF